MLKVKVHRIHGWNNQTNNLFITIIREEEIQGCCVSALESVKATEQSDIISVILHL